MAFKGTPKTLDKTLQTTPPPQNGFYGGRGEREIKIFPIEKKTRKEEVEVRRRGEKFNNRFSLSTYTA
jgi:hypothetical protein